MFKSKIEEANKMRKILLNARQKPNWRSPKSVSIYKKREFEISLMQYSTLEKECNLLLSAV